MFAKMRIVSAAFVLLISICFSFLAAEFIDGDDFEFFEKQVRPLLIEKCFQCHSGEKAGGGLSLESKTGWTKGGENGRAIIPGDPQKSLLIQAINYRDLEMPPADEGGKLTASQIEVLTKWVKMGAPDPRTATNKIGGMTLEQAKAWWSFQPIPQKKLDSEKKQTETINKLIHRRIREFNLRASSRADKRTLIRRATYDLTGLPPNLAEVDAFLNDTSPNAFDKVIDRLLASEQYGVRWGRHWLDVVRYADTAGENSDRPLPHMWRYRNWVLDSFNNDMPFDQFVAWQLAGDIINQPTSETDSADKDFENGVIATGYLAVARRFGHDIDKDIHLMHEDVIDNVGKNFLGLTMGCARCHDHKYDPISAEDYYALYGIFASTKFSFPGCEPIPQPRDLIPLLPKSEIESRQKAFAKRLAEWGKSRPADPVKTKKLKEIATPNLTVLAEGKVKEGSSVSLESVNQDQHLNQIHVAKGEVIQLTILPNANHGADTTTVDFKITRKADNAVWDVADLIPIFADGGPMINVNNAAWCFLEVTNGPSYLLNRIKAVSGQSGLSAWRLEDTPSVFVNANSDPVNVWTTLPAKTFFMHPAHHRPVAIAWVCPADGQYSIAGSISDGHPAPSLDGVSFRIEKVSSAIYGNGLIELGQRAIRDIRPKPQTPSFPVAFAVREARPMNAAVHLRGDPEQQGAPVARRWIGLFGGEKVPADSGSGRVQLAEWIVKNPLFARVLANRIWQWHFGQGIVTTANDFGSRGAAPTHPELLDYLASQLKANRFQLKPLHRAIMKSEAYRRSSLATTESLERDPENQTLSRFSRRRLSAEEIRDSLLAASGELDLSFAAQHPFPPEQTWRFTQHAPFHAVYESNRRSAFLMVQRQRHHPFLALFDGPDPNSSTPDRQSTTVPTQALYFLNDPFFHEQARMFAAGLESTLKERSKVELVFQRLLQRKPTAQEHEIALQFLERHPGDSSKKWAAFARIMMASNEFLYLD